MNFQTRLGRRAARDTRDDAYPLRSLIRAVPAVRYRYWPAYQIQLDQGNTPRCVEYAWSQWHYDSPTTHRGVLLPQLPAYGTPLPIYDRAQQVDEWPGEEPDYQGTSVRAGAKVLQELGVIGRYHWAQSVSDVVDHILTRGPVVVGTNFYEAMTWPWNPYRADYGKTGVVVEALGELLGGHAYKLDGANVDLKLVRWKQSWGGVSHAYMTFQTLDRLLAEDGEACAAIEADA